MSYIKSANRNQARLYTSLDDQIEESNPVRIIDVLIDKILADNSDLITESKDTGRPRYHDGAMLKMMLYSYLHRIRSSRRIERECSINIELRWLVGELVPDHWTIAHYRVEQEAKIKSVTKLFRQFIKEQGYITGDLVALDGTKIKANAKRAMLNSETLKRRVNKLDEDVEEYLNKLKEMDLLEDADIDPDNKTEVLDKLTTAHQEIAQMQELIKRLKEEKRNFISASDPDANLLRTTNGKMPAYNVQLIVDNEHKLIADTEVFTDTTDNQLMGPMLESYREELGELPKVIVADKGYMTPLHLKETEAKLQEQQQSVTILAANKKQPNSSEEGKEEITFTFDKKNNRYICSEGKPLPLMAKNIQKNKTLYDKYQGTECNQCPKKSQCTNSKRGRYHNRPHHQEWIDEYATRVQTPEAQALLKQRKAIVEHPNGTIKWMMAQAQFVLRGLEKVKIEINLLATCYNLKRMWKILTFAELGQRIRSYNWKMA